VIFSIFSSIYFLVLEDIKKRGFFSEAYKHMKKLYRHSKKKVQNLKKKVKKLVQTTSMIKNIVIFIYYHPPIYLET